MANIPLRDTVPLEAISWIVIWPMRRNLLRFSSFLAELLAAESSRATIPRRKPPRSAKNTSARTTHTFLLANPNLEGEIHLKGGRFLTSQFSIWMFIIDLMHPWFMHFFPHFFIWFLIQGTFSNSRTKRESWKFPQNPLLKFQSWDMDQIGFHQKFISIISKIK